MVQSVQNSVEDAAIEADFEPIQGKDITSSEQCPLLSPSSPMDILDIIPPIQSPDEDQEDTERKEEDDNVPYFLAYCPICYPQ